MLSRQVSRRKLGSVSRTRLVNMSIGYPLHPHVLLSFTPYVSFAHELHTGWFRYAQCMKNVLEQVKPIDILHIIYETFHKTLCVLKPNGLGTDTCQ